MNTQTQCEACFRGHERWTAGLALIAGSALGAAVMYYADPHRGKARRGELEQKGARLARQAGHQLAKQAEDLLNRAKGLIAEAETAIDQGEQSVDDDILAERVRSHLGHFTPHASAIETEVIQGVVALRGTIAPERKRAVVREILSIHGVKGVRDLLVAA
jgi:osmotically-inducible protein OsmY